MAAQEQETVPQVIQRATVAGAGRMGSGIAQVLATAGIDVTLVDVDAARLQQAGDAIDASLTRVARQQSLDPAAVQSIRARIRFTTVLDASAGPDLLVEAVVEDLATKQRVLERRRGSAAGYGPPRLQHLQHLHHRPRRRRRRSRSAWPGCTSSTPCR